MAYSEHIRVTFGGNIVVGPDPAEIWACTVNGVPATGDVNTFDTDAYLGEMHADLATWFSAAANGNAQQASLTYVKANAINSEGHYSSSTTTSVYDYPAPRSGGASMINPQIMSLVISWTTAVARGPGSAGRVFLPNPTFGTSNSMFVPVNDLVNACGSGRGLLDAIRNSAGSHQLEPVVASGVNGALTPINGVRVGNVKDVQRRRKDAYRETYTATPWP